MANELQVWTMIGVFVAIMSSVLGLLSAAFLRVLRAEIGSLSSDVSSQGTSLRAEMGTLATDLRAEMGTLATDLRADMSTLSAEIKAEIRVLDNKVDLLDRDVQAIARHVFPDRD